MANDAQSAPNKKKGLKPNENRASPVQRRLRSEVDIAMVTLPFWGSDTSGKFGLFENGARCIDNKANGIVSVMR
tara:strand:+ start:1290 stop:1511 length:222 start_codon:yes stop_codon:yes gene_type:complete